MEKIIVTGANGFIAKRIIKLLESKGFNVLKVVRKKNKFAKNQIICDFEENFLEEGYLEGISSVFHLAGITSDSPKKIKKIKRVNEDVTINLAEKCVKRKIKNFFFYSSVKVNSIESSSNLNQNLINSYAFYKKKSEDCLLEIFKESETSLKIIRSSVVYGPKAKGNIGLITKGIKSGWFPSLKNINNKKSMIHVDDLARLSIFLYENEKVEENIIYASDYQTYSTSQICDIIRKKRRKKLIEFSLDSKFIKFLSNLNFLNNFKINNLLNDEEFHSKNLKAQGFHPKYTFEDFDKKI